MRVLDTVSLCLLDAKLRLFDSEVSVETGKKRKRKVRHEFQTPRAYDVSNSYDETMV